MYKRRRIFEAREKILFEGAEPGTYVQFFKDGGDLNLAEAAALDAAGAAEGEQKAPPENWPDGRAVLRNRISEYIFMRLREVGVPSYFIKSLNMREQLVHITEMLPLKIVCCNRICGALAQRLGLAEGGELPHPILEFYYKDEKLGNPLVSEDHILAFNWANEQDLEEIIALAARINDFLCGLFAAIGLHLAEFKLEFGRLWEGDMMRIVLADEISPDSCRLWARAVSGHNIKEADAAANEGEPKAEAHKRIGHKYVARKLGLLNEERPHCGKGPVLVRS